MNGKHYEPKQRSRVTEIGFVILMFCVVAILLGFIIKAEIYDEPTEPTHATDTATMSKAETEATTEYPTERELLQYDLLLVNRESKLPHDYTVNLVKLENGLQVSSECYDALQKLLADCIAAGNTPVVCSAYRSVDEQAELFDNKVSELMRVYNYSDSKAKQEAARSVSPPGYSEHHTGLAVDIVDINNQNLETYQEDTDTQQWLIAHSWEYGFILRYPEGKSSQTGVEYEPWHYRYVGEYIAAALHESGMCYEEYVVGCGYFNYE